MQTHEGVIPININCGRCSHVYALDADRDVINVYATDAQHTHLCTKCPACGVVMRLFGINVDVLAPLNLRVTVYTDPAPKAIAALARQAKGVPVAKKNPQPPPLPEIPRDWLIELLDTLRHFGQPCDGSCGIPRGG